MGRKILLLTTESNWRLKDTSRQRWPGRNNERPVRKDLCEDSSRAMEDWSSPRLSRKYSTQIGQPHHVRAQTLLESFLKESGALGRQLSQRVVALQHGKLSSVSRAHIQKPGMVTHTCDPSSGLVEAGKSLGLAGSSANLFH